MKLVKFTSDEYLAPSVGLMEGDRVQPLSMPGSSLKLSDLLHSHDAAAEVDRLLKSAIKALPMAEVRLLAPIDNQEVWGAGVTYLRSKVARMEESQQGGSFYDLVYAADRPELFFKANPRRVSGPGDWIRVRQDTNWCVPEPELALVISPEYRLVGFTIGNDVSARDIEGQNPLYLPQAKVYDNCCALGPSIAVASRAGNPRAWSIDLAIDRDGKRVFQQSTHVDRIVRTFDELIGWLARDQSFPDGVILLTGTGIVPPDEFTLEPGDQVSIRIDAIGELVNYAVKHRPDATAELPLTQQLA